MARTPGEKTMLKPRCYFIKVSMVLCGMLFLWACTSDQSLHHGTTAGTGGSIAGAGGTLLAGGTGGSLSHEDYWCGTSISIYPCGGASGAGGTGGAGGTTGAGGATDRDASGEGIDVGPADASSWEAAPDLTVAEVPIRGMDSQGVDSDGVLRGYQVYGNELMAFELCGSSELIWMNLTGWEKGLDRIPAQSCPGDAGLGTCVRHLYTELTGVISPPGSYGHLSKFSRELRVQEFLNVSLAESPTCPFLPPVYPN